MRKKIILTITFIVLLVLTGTLGSLLFPEIAIPLGALCVSLFLLAVYGFVIIVLVRQKEKKPTRKDKIGKVVIVFAFALMLLFACVQGVKATLDIGQGMQEMVVRDVQLQKTHGTSRTGSSYYLICNTQDGEQKRIKIHSIKDGKVYAELFTEAEGMYGVAAEYVVFYHENMNVVYDIEIKK